MDSDPAGADLSLPEGVRRCVCWPTSAGAGVPGLALEQDVVPTTVRIVRTAIRDWAAVAGLDPETLDAVVLAVDEAVANVVDHAYPASPDGTRVAGPGGRIVVTAASRACGGGVAVSVVDEGTWRPPPADPGYRGRGVRVIGWLAERSTITPTSHGTTARMCWAQPCAAPNGAGTAEPAQ